MNTETSTALHASVRHWREMRLDPYRHKPFTAECALCRVYRYDSCCNCPVCLSTGVDDCHESPYVEAASAHYNYLRLKTSYSRWYDAATREIEFLESLLPKED